MVKDSFLSYSNTREQSLPRFIFTTWYTTEISMHVCYRLLAGSRAALDSSSYCLMLKKLLFPAAPVVKDRRWRGDIITPNSTQPLMNDEANCGNGLLLFGSDKYCDK